MPVYHAQIKEFELSTKKASLLAGATLFLAAHMNYIRGGRAELENEGYSYNKFIKQLIYNKKTNSLPNSSEIDEILEDFIAMKFNEVYSRQSSNNITYLEELNDPSITTTYKKHLAERLAFRELFIMGYYPRTYNSVYSIQISKNITIFVDIDVKMAFDYSKKQPRIREDLYTEDNIRKVPFYVFPYFFIVYKKDEEAEKLYPDYRDIEVVFPEIENEYDFWGTIEEKIDKILAPYAFVEIVKTYLIKNTKKINEAIAEILVRNKKINSKKDTLPTLVDVKTSNKTILSITTLDSYLDEIDMNNIEKYNKESEDRIEQTQQDQNDDSKINAFFDKYVVEIDTPSIEKNSQTKKNWYNKVVYTDHYDDSVSVFDENVGTFEQMKNTLTICKPQPFLIDMLEKMLELHKEHNRETSTERCVEIKNKLYNAMRRIIDRADVSYSQGKHTPIFNKNIANRNISVYVYVNIDLMGAHNENQKRGVCIFAVIRVNNCVESIPFVFVPVDSIINGSSTNKTEFLLETLFINIDKDIKTYLFQKNIPYNTEEKIFNFDLNNLS